MPIIAKIKEKLSEYENNAIPRNRIKFLMYNK